jgi:hypothetical protein
LAAKRYDTPGQVISFFEYGRLSLSWRRGPAPSQKERAMKKRTKLPMKFVRASGAPISDADAQVIGQELLKIAEANKVGDLRQLSKRIIWAELKNDSSHPLWQFCPRRDVQSAAEAYWTDWCGRIINWVRVTVIQGKITYYKPIAVSVETSGIQTRPSRRVHVLREDVLTHDPEFASAMGFQIRAVQHAVNRMAWSIGERELPPNMADLYAGLRDCLDRYQASLAPNAVDAAAE